MVSFFFISSRDGAILHPTHIHENASASRLSNNPSTLRQAQRDACRADSPIRPRTKSPSKASGSDSTRATTPANSSCRLSGEMGVVKFSFIYLL
jgi:hypothetical protein